jgi:hypothetical protein
MKTSHWVAGALLLFSPAQADTVHCVTGDQIRGKLIAVTESEVRVKSEIAGLLTIPREKVLSIAFDRVAISPRPLSLTPSPLNASPTNTTAELNKALQQVDPAQIAKVQEEFLSTATPEAQAMFRETLQGLMSGKINVQDIRTQAQDALKQLNELSADLGDDEVSGLIGTYGALLQNFLKQTAPASTNSSAVTTPTRPAKVEDEE